MVFVNLDRNKPKQPLGRGGVPPRIYKCLNCGNVIDYPFGSIDARRFCSTRCKEQYFQQDI